MIKLKLTEHLIHNIIKIKIIPEVTKCSPRWSTANEVTGPLWQSILTIGVVMLGVHMVTKPD
jgi:hypothetical protein